MKAYLKTKKLTTPVGYADNDDPKIRMNLINYFNCGDEETRADFYGINTYRWCGDKSDFESSGYSDITKNMTDYTIPSLLTEYGCNLVRPRTFSELKSLYGSDMADTFSGGIMYEFTEEDNEYGIVKVSYGDSKAEKNDDYDNLKDALKAASPKGVKMDDYKPGGKDSECPEASSDWKVAPRSLSPTPSADRCQCMMDSLGCTFKNDNLTASEGKAVGTIIGDICGQTSCDEISYDTTKGEYGDFVACDAHQRAAWAINKSFEDQRGAKCSAGDIDVKTVDSPKQSDVSECVARQDDNGNDGTSAGASNKDADDDEDSDASDGDNTSAASALAVRFPTTVVAGVVAALLACLA
ncbi:1 3-beta-glucanosyltransferase gel4 [Coemansia guatemalensis]|uniref:1,3-beta-glucanosyltransferase n=1 Tax=Coemansia guatemalensis TaxID=2761395 RepID=A0A9W8HWI4_9FUNG|nr:1 3-beta-glucanosyltransferase gel4 [Coemansia guatemalensis]